MEKSDCVVKGCFFFFVIVFVVVVVVVVFTIKSALFC